MGTARRQAKAKSLRSTEAPPALRTTAAGRAAHWFWYAGASAAVILPCYWQSRIQAGDLSSHIYNAWLARGIASGQIHGLTLVHQTTNILFDLLLSSLLPLTGAAAAQKLAVSIAVLIFVWGAFRFVRAVSGRDAWPMLPALAVLGYGWVFHMGFFNFYLSLGLCLWGLALAWKGGRRRLAIAVLLFACAWIAHLLPVLWSAGMLGYRWAAGRLSWRRRLQVLGGYAGLLVVAHFAILRTFTSSWNARQFLLATGADQAWIFDDKYYLTFAALAVIWGLLLVDLALGRSMRAVVSSLPFELCAINAAAVVILPTEASGHGFTASFIADRLSLLTGICVCAVLASGKAGALRRYGLPLVALAFFVFLFRDERILNAFEDRIESAAASLPPYQRVVSGIYDSDLHIDPLTHMIDRACIGRCYSYGNYEPSSGEFRVRAAGPNGVVTANYVDSWLLENGAYRVKPRDAPLYEVGLDESGALRTQVLQAGDATRSAYWKVLPALF